MRPACFHSKVEERCGERKMSANVTKKKNEEKQGDTCGRTQDCRKDKDGGQCHWGYVTGGLRQSVRVEIETTNDRALTCFRDAIDTGGKEKEEKMPTV